MTRKKRAGVGSSVTDKGRAATGRRGAITLEFDRGSLLLSAARTAKVPSYLAWDERVGSWRTEALNHGQLKEDVAEYRITLDDHAERFFPCPPLRSTLPPLRPDQE